MNPRSNDTELTRHIIDEWYHRVSTGQAEISRLEGEIEVLKKQQQDIQTNLLPAKMAAIASVEAHIARLEVALKTLEQVGDACQLDKLEVKLREAQKQLEMTQANQRNIGIITGALAKLEQDDPSSPHVGTYRSIIAKHKFDQEEANRLIQLYQEQMRQLNPAYGEARAAIVANGVSHEPIKKQDLERHLNDKLDELNQLRSEKDRLEVSLSQFQGNIDSAVQLLAKADDEVKNLLADEYLNHLWNHPTILIDSLIGDIRVQLAAYEAAYPANQTADVQKALYEIERGVNYIKVISSDDVTERRKKYYELVGLLQHVQECNANVYSQGLDKVVEAILAKHRIAADEAKEAYKDLCRSHVDALPTVTTELVNKHLNRKYAEARQRLRQAFDACYRARTPELNILLHKGIAVLEEVENEKITHFQNGDKLFDVKFYTKLLDKTAKVMHEPQNEALRAEYHQLATHNKSGRASLSTKLAGAMLALIGAAVLVTTIVADVMSLGASVPVLWTGKIGGSVACLMGIGLFASGMRSGIAQAADNFEATAKSTKTSPAARRGRAGHEVPSERSALLSNRR